MWEGQAGTEARFSERRSNPGDIAPAREGPIAHGATIFCSCLLWIGNVEEVGDLIVNRQKSLRLPGRFESFHDAFASPRRLMRVLRAIV